MNEISLYPKIINCLNIFRNQYVSPNIDDNNQEQIISCINQIISHLENGKLSKKLIIKQTYFVNVATKQELIDIQEIITKQTKIFFEDFIPLSIIPQPSAGKHFITAEYTLLDSLENNRISTKEANGIKYLEVENEHGIYIIASGLESKIIEQNIYDRSVIAFDQMKQILDKENIDFSDVIRQWNYIEKIIDESNSSQHYQIFNDVRSLYYEKCNFKNGYPAATGIGMETGGIIIDFIALKKSDATKITAIRSQLQTDAHQYSKDVLAENHLPITSVKTTPKFERAKAITTSKNGILYISGTAAIKGEHSATSYSAAQQTQMTLENIKSLYSDNNLSNFGINEFNTTPLSYRVYIKNVQDVKSIVDIVKNNIGNTPVIFLKADICRTELLVEIEAKISLTPKSLQ